MKMNPVVVSLPGSTAEIRRFLGCVGVDGKETVCPRRQIDDGLSLADIVSTLPGVARGFLAFRCAHFRAEAGGRVHEADGPEFDKSPVYMVGELAGPELLVAGMVGNTPKTGWQERGKNIERFADYAKLLAELRASPSRRLVRFADGAFCTVEPDVVVLKLDGTESTDVLRPDPSWVPPKEWAGDLFSVYVAGDFVLVYADQNYSYSFADIEVGDSEWGSRSNRVNRRIDAPKEGATATSSVKIGGGRTLVLSWDGKALSFEIEPAKT